MPRVSYSLCQLFPTHDQEWAYESGPTLKAFYSLEEAEEALPRYVTGHIKRIYCLSRGDAPSRLDIRSRIREEALRTYVVVLEDDTITYFGIYQDTGRG